MTAAAQGERLAGVYRHIYETAMRDTPICNDALEVEAVGFREYGELALGVIVTPWFANLVATALDETRDAPLLAAQELLRLRFPAGEAEFNPSELDGFGHIATCSLFSPMHDFVDHAAARDAAEAALTALFDPHLHEAPQERRDESAGLDRRALLGGRRKAAAS